MRKSIVVLIVAVLAVAAGALRTQRKVFWKILCRK